MKNAYRAGLCLICVLLGGWAVFSITIQNRGSASSSQSLRQLHALKDLRKSESLEHTAHPSNLTAVEATRLTYAQEINFQSVLDRMIREKRDINDIYKLIEKFSPMHPEQVAKSILLIEDFRQRQYLLNVVLQAWAKKDAVEARTWLQNNLSGNDLVATMNSLMVIAISNNRALAEEWLKEYPTGPVKAGLMNLLGMSLLKSNMNSGIDWASSNLGDIQKNNLFSNYASELAKQGDLAGVEQLLEILPFGAPRNNVIKQLAGALAQNSIDDARKWLGQLESGDSTVAAPIVFANWAKTDPSGAANEALRIKSQESIGSILYEWAKLNPEDAIQWTGNLMGEQRDRGVATILGSWSADDPEKAANYVDNMTEGKLKDKILDDVVSTWARTDPGKVAAYLENLETSSHDEAVRVLVAIWLVNDSLAASKWVRALPPGSAQDSGSAQIAESMVQSDPASATQWALSISNPIQREEALDGTLKAWANFNLDQAKEAVRKMELRNGDLNVANKVLNLKGK